MGRANSFGALVAGLAADESLLPGEAVNTSSGPTACWSGTAGSRARRQGGRQRPGLPGADGDGERPVLLAQALPLLLHGDVAAEPVGPPRLARLPLPGQPGRGQMGPDRKGGAPYPDGRRDLPQPGVGAASPVI